jgi:hypothetical protein
VLGTCFPSDQSFRLTKFGEVSEHLVGSPAFKAGVVGEPHEAGSIPVHLRHLPQTASSISSGV